ncbi:ComEC family competence protein, partial [Candidatus Wolfebacteria bacterium]|nr:ComEC family competence protein [Candidatus Wolfebacteria bacterium]
MRIYDIVFYAAGFFILGILVASLGLNFKITFLITLLSAVLFLFFGYIKQNNRIIWIAGLCLFIIIGNFYYFLYDEYQAQKTNIVFNEKTDFQGVIIKYPEKGNFQKLVVNLEPPYSGRILIETQRYPEFYYGDLIAFEGKIIKPSNLGYANFLAKEGISGTVSFLEVELIAKDKGLKIKSCLFKLRNKIVSIFQKTLSFKKAAFLAGITLGERAEFSKKFKEAMNASGTTHLVALSGYNITVIVTIVFILLNSFFRRRITFLITILTIIGFVLLTGGEASVVRAAIMGFIALFAREVNRVYSARNAIILSAFFMVLFNPKVLYFDVGFQLSFFALLGIIYFLPAVKNFLKLSEDSSIFSIKENFLLTFSAQIFVLPVLIINFGNFSAISLFTNILILEIIPLTMAVGFIIGFLGLFSYYLALVFSWFINLLLSYEIFIIEFFGQKGVFQIKSFNSFLITF